MYPSCWFAGTIVGIACAVLIFLYMFQWIGTNYLGWLFSPIVLLWLLFNMMIGIYNIAHWHPGTRHPSLSAVLPAKSPRSFLHLKTINYHTSQGRSKHPKHVIATKLRIGSNVGPCLSEQTYLHVRGFMRTQLPRSLHSMLSSFHPTSCICVLSRSLFRQQRLLTIPSRTSCPKALKEQNLVRSIENTAHTPFGTWMT